MNGQEFLDRVRDDNETALSRLGSSKAVYALTDGEMTAEAVRAAAADEAHALGVVAGEWATEGEGEAADLFEEVAAMADRNYEAVDAGGAPTEDAVLSAALEGLETPVERVAGVAGALTVLGKFCEQFVGFFVGDADPQAADSFRGFRSDVEELRDRAAETLGTVGKNGTDWDVAVDVADDVVGTTYDWYVETLEGMGVEPKNVC